MKHLKSVRTDIICNFILLILNPFLQINNCISMSVTILVLKWFNNLFLSI